MGGFGKKEFIETSIFTAIAFVVLSVVLMLYAPDIWSNDVERGLIALTLLLFVLSHLLAHHVSLETDRIIEEIHLLKPKEDEK